MNIKFSLVILLLFVALARAQVATADGYTLSKENINLVLKISEILAETNISNSDKAEIVNWTIEDFKTGAEEATNAYEVLNDWLELLNNAQSQFEYDLVKYKLYNSLYFDWKILGVAAYESFLDIVQRYNPVIYYDDKTRLLIVSSDPIIARTDDYPLSSLMQESTLRVGEWLARAQFNQNDTKALSEWIIEDFYNNPQNSAANNAYFLNDLLPTIYLQNKPDYELEDLREVTYQRFYFAFQAEEVMANSNNDLMDVVARYNPVIIEDKANQLLITQSVIDEALIMYEFLEGIVSSSIIVDDKVKTYEKTALINSFVNRADKSKYNSGSWFLMRSRALWRSLNDSDKNILTQQMKQIYSSSASVEQALNPLFATLRKIVQQEQQILANIYAQTLYLNQQAFNDILNTQAGFNEMILNNIAETSTRQSLAISGATILFETDDYFEVEYEEGGVNYRVYK